MIAIAIATVGILPSCSSQSGTSSNTSSYYSPEPSVSERPSTSSPSDPILMEAEKITGKVRQYGYINNLTEWNNFSPRQIVQLAENICSSYSGQDTTDFATAVSRALGGQDDARSMTEARFIIIACMEIRCRGRYSQFLIKAGTELQQDSLPR
ncbi:hypothetical protein ACE1CI_24915 [Aerosakkonemataceae cyanobacterium BLCC-F50]|uniref:Lipoprotein n=1 Tax=Floridaenema flaviceps BLCC-F50 TaxID=3153642 RepID=A0ABV4XWY2_9CYAN